MGQILGPSLSISKQENWWLFNLLLRWTLTEAPELVSKKIIVNCHTHTYTHTDTHTTRHPLACTYPLLPSLLSPEMEPSLDHLKALFRPWWGGVIAFQIPSHPTPCRQLPARGEGDSFFHCFNLILIECMAGDTWSP